MPVTMTPHTSNACPCDPALLVAYRLLGDPDLRVDVAGALAWGLLGEPGRIAAWALLDADDPGTDRGPGAGGADPTRPGRPAGALRAAAGRRRRATGAPRHRGLQHGRSELWFGVDA
jgi:hypothetical protein